MNGASKQYALILKRSNNSTQSPTPTDIISLLHLSAHTRMPTSEGTLF